MNRNSAKKLQRHIEKIEKLELAIKYTYLVAKAEGFDPNTMKDVVRLRAMKVAARRKAAAIPINYRQALGLD